MINASFVTSPHTHAHRTSHTAHHTPYTALQCHKAPFDDQLSGTTGITALVLGKRLYIANVGDSRAIICSQMGKDGNKIMAEPLSIDQTPFRKDERERVKLVGAKVLTIDQIEVRVCKPRYPASNDTMDIRHRFTRRCRTYDIYYCR